MKYYNTVSIAIGIGLTVFLCLIFLSLAPAEPIYRLSGISAIVSLVFFAGCEKLPSVSQGILEVAGRRIPKKRFGEGWAWKLVGLCRIIQESARQKTLNIPPIEAMAKDNVEVKLNGIQMLARVVNPARICRLKDGLDTLPNLLLGKAREAFREYVIKHASAHCIRAEKELQELVKNRIEQEVEEFGIEITAVDIGPIMEAEEIRTARRESKAKEIKAQRFVETLKKIKEEAKKLTDNEATNTALVVQGDVKKELKEETQTTKFGLEAETVKAVAEVVAMFLPKKDKEIEKEQGDKK